MTFLKGIDKRAWTDNMENALEHIERWADIAFPVATTFALVGQNYWSNTTLMIWVCCRLTVLAEKQGHHNWILMGLALANFGTIVLDRGQKPSDPSDILIIALSLAAGLQRSKEQWRHSASLIALCIIPVGIAALLNEPGMLLQFPEINVNRLSFFLGLIAISGYAATRWEIRPMHRLGWATLTTVALPLGLMTGSRAALAAPAIAISLSWILSTYFKKRKESNTRIIRKGIWAPILAALIAISGLTAYFWYAGAQDSVENRLNDHNRFETAACWFNAPIERGVAMTGLGLNNKVRKHCNGKNLPRMGKLGHTKGLPHAHNVASQAMGEMGIPGLAVVAGTTIWAIRTAGNQLKDRRNFSITHLSVTTLIYLVITGAATSHYIYLMINQTLIGYLLSALGCKNEPAKKECDFTVNPAGQAFGA